MNRETFKRVLGGILILLGLAVIPVAVWAWWTTDDWSYALVGIAFIPLITWGWSLFSLSDPPPLEIQPHDPIMMDAIHQARQSADEFLKGLRSNNFEPYVKIEMLNVEGGAEHVWAIVHSADDAGVLTVSVVSEPLAPLDTKNVREAVRLSQIEDWMLIDIDGRIRGDYSEVAMAKIYERDKGYVPAAIRKRLAHAVEPEAVKDS